MKKSNMYCKCCNSKRDLWIFLIGWVVVFAGLITAAAILDSLPIPVGARIVSVSDVSTRDNFGVVIDQITRFELESALIEGRIETDTFRRPDDTTYDLTFDINDVQTQCEMSFYRTVCDVRLDNSASTWGCFPGYTCQTNPDNCKGLCSHEVITGKPMCAWGLIRAPYCAVGKMIPTNCYDVWTINPVHCKPTGTISANLVDIVSAVDETAIFDMITGYTQTTTFGGTLDMTFTVDHLDRNSPFGRELIVLTPEGLTTTFSVVERSVLCVFNNEVGCKGPVYKDSGNYHAITNWFTRMTWKTINWNEQTFSSDNNRLLTTAVSKANPLKSYVGSFTFNTTSYSITFQQTKPGTIKFDVDIFDDQFINADIPDCDVISSDITCTGSAIQELADCELKLVVAPAVGGAIDLEWNGDTIPIECVSGTKTLPNIPIIEGKALEYTIYANGADPIKGAAKATATHPAADEDQDGHIVEEGNGKEVNQDKIYDKSVERNDTWNVFLIFMIIILSAIGAVGAVLVIWRLVVLYQMDEDEYERLQGTTSGVELSES